MLNLFLFVASLLVAVYAVDVLAEIVLDSLDDFTYSRKFGSLVVAGVVTCVGIAVITLAVLVLPSLLVSA